MADQKYLASLAKGATKAHAKVHPDDDAKAAQADEDEAAVAEFKVCEYALGFLHRENPLRAFLLRLVQSKAFDTVILFVILFNSVCMAMTDYRGGCLARNASKPEQFGTPDPVRCGQNGFVEAMNKYVFFTVFLAECVFKVVALGFVCEGRGAYLRDAWNVLDFVCVAAMVLQTAEFGDIDLKMIRTFRLLRPLKSVNKFPSLKKLVMTLLMAIPRLGNVVILLVFLLLVFSIAGIQFFKGTLHYRCRLTQFPSATPATWYASCGAADVAANPHRFLADGGNCVRGTFFPTNAEFDAYKAVMVEWNSRDIASWPELSKTSAYAAPFAEWGWGNASSYAGWSDWACQGGKFRAPEYPYGFPITDTYPHKYPDYAVGGDGYVWPRPQKCVWLVDEDDTRPCALPNSGGLHRCYNNVRQQRSRGKFSSDYAHPEQPSLDLDPLTLRLPLDASLGLTTCGSNFDQTGNLRFEFGKPLYQKQEVKKSVPKKLNDWGRYPRGLFFSLNPIFIEDLNYGYTHFDNLGWAMIALFQAVTMEGWTDIMYMYMNVYEPVVPLTLFLLLFGIGSMLVLNLVLGVIADTLNDEEQAEEEREAEEKANAVAAGTYEVPPLERSESSNLDVYNATLQRGSLKAWAFAVVTHEAFNFCIYACIFANTLALWFDDYPRSPQWAFAVSMINLALSLIFIVEMFLKLYALGYDLYVSDSFNCFDGAIVWVGIFSMIFAAAGLNFGGGAVSALRCARVFRIFKLAKNWKSLQILLKTMVETAQQIGPFLVLLVLFTFIFTLAGMQFFANELRFDEETGGKIRFSSRRRFYDNASDRQDRPGRRKGVLGDKKGWSQRKVHSAFKDSTPPDMNFDDFGIAWVTVFAILTGESWNILMYDMMRGKNSIAWGVAYMFASNIFLGFFIMNMFLAILLAGFEDNDELAAPRPLASARDLPGLASGAVLHRKLTMKDAARSTIAIKAGPKFRLKEVVAAALVEARARSSSAAVAPEDDAATQVTAANQDTPEASNPSPLQQSPSMPPPPPRRPDLALGLFPPESPFRQFCVAATADWRFDAFIVSCILVSSAMLAATTPLMNPLSQQALIFEGFDLVFNIAFFVECVLKVCSTGFLFNGPKSYLRDPWNDLDFMIVTVSIVDLFEIKGVKAIKVLRVFRVFRPLRMLSRNPGLKLVLNCLVVAIPNAMNVMLVCIIILLIFAIMGVGFFKGQMDACDFGMPLPATFLEATESDVHFIRNIVTYPINLRAAVKQGRFERLLNLTQGDPRCWVDFDENYINNKWYFNPKTNVASDEVWRLEQVRPSVVSSTFEGAGNLKFKMVSGVGKKTQKYFLEHQLKPDESRQMKYDYLVSKAGNVDKFIPTSKDMCQCVYWDKQNTAWANPLYMNFDDVLSAFMLLFEIYSTEGWLDYMFHNVDARGIEMQPVRDHNYRPQRSVPRFYSYSYHIGFQFVGGFFAMQLFVGVIIEQFSKLKQAAEAEGRSGLFLTAAQEQWAKTQQFLAKLKPRRKVRPVIVAFHAVVEGEHKALFENLIMTCILLNGGIMCLDHFGQPRELTTAVTVLNYSFAGIFTVEAMLKIGGIGWGHYICDDWNKFDFLIVVGTLLGIAMTLFTSSGIGGVASVVRLFRIARIFRLFNSAKNLKKQITALLSAVPQMFNVMLVLMIFISIFAILLVQLYAHIEYSGAVQTNANFQEFGTAVLTLLRFTTGENWNGFMHDMNFKWKSTGCWKLFSRFDSVRQAMYAGNEAEAVWSTKWCTRQDGNDRPVCPCKKFTRHGEVKDLCQVYASYDDCCVPLGGCGDKWVAGIVIHIFDLLVTGVVLNLFVGIILDAYGQDDAEADADENGLTAEHLQAFVDDWSHFDENATWFIELARLKEFIQILDEPMGFGEQYVASTAELEASILALDIRLRTRCVDEDEPGKSRVHIRDVAAALGKRVIAKQMGTGVDDPFEARASARKQSNDAAALLVSANPLLLRLFAEDAGAPPRPRAAFEAPPLEPRSGVSEVPRAMGAIRAAVLKAPRAPEAPRAAAATLRSASLKPRAVPAPPNGSPAQTSTRRPSASSEGETQSNQGAPGSDPWNETRRIYADAYESDADEHPLDVIPAAAAREPHPLDVVPTDAATLDSDRLPGLARQAAPASPPSAPVRATV
ncbi:Ion transport protein-domain-containing protein [Pelagophyceae sp. CCMP2097]|nr:Ion transport protein-domain-containing protein [Pelagophyceae sp. CCMP2097]